MAAQPAWRRPERSLVADCNTQRAHHGHIHQRRQHIRPHRHKQTHANAEYYLYICFVHLSLSKCTIAYINTDVNVQINIVLACHSWPKREAVYCAACVVTVETNDRNGVQTQSVCATKRSLTLCPLWTCNICAHLNTATSLRTCAACRHTHVHAQQNTATQLHLCVRRFQCLVP